MSIDLSEEALIRDEISALKLDRAKFRMEIAGIAGKLRILRARLRKVAK